MSSCPECGLALDEDFGVVICDGCGASLLIEIDGSVRVQSENIEYATTGTENAIQSPSLLDDDSPYDFAQDNQTLYDSESLDQGDDLFAGESLSGDVDLVSTEKTPEDSLDSYEVSDVESLSSEPQDSRLSDESFEDVMEFANSDEAQSHDGTLRYDLVLSGIDMKDIRFELREVLLDSRFHLDTATVMASIKDGQLTLRNLGPAKIYLLVRRLQHLPIEIQWRQYAIYES